MFVARELKASLRTRSVGVTPRPPPQRDGVQAYHGVATRQCVRMTRGHGDCPLPARPAQRPQGREHTLAHASHGRSAARSNRRPITSRIQSLHQPSHPLSVSGSAQPHDGRLAPSLPPGEPRTPTPPGWPARNHVPARARAGGRGFFTGPTAAGVARRRLLFRGRSTAGYTATAAGAERGHPPLR